MNYNFNNKNIKNNKIFNSRNSNSNLKNYNPAFPRHRIQKFKNNLNNIGNMGDYITDINIKQQLIDYIYSTVELANFKYKIIETEQDLPLLLKHKHYISANFSGSNCLLLFVKLRDEYYSCLIDRKTLSYNQYQVDPKSVIIANVYIRLDRGEIYKGSIFDGILINNGKQKLYVITDVFYFKGKNESENVIKNKLSTLGIFLKNNLKEDSNFSNIKIIINKLYEPEKIETLVKRDIPHTKEFNIKGITFYPDISGTKLIYMFDNNLTNGNKSNSINYNNSDFKYTNNLSLKPKKVNDNNKNIDKNNINGKVVYRYISKTNDPIFATFELKKTNYADVYKLYLTETVERDTRIILKSKKMGIAYIPTLECSALCKKTFVENSKNDRVLMKCKFINDKNKWQPVEYDQSSKFPTNISEIVKVMDIIEDVSSDDDFE